MKKIIIVNLIISSLLVSSGLLINNLFFAKKIVYVKLNDLYKKFELTGSLEKKAEKTINTKQNILDSLKLDLEMNYRTLKAKGSTDKVSQDELQKMAFLKQNYLDKKENFDKTNSEMLKMYEEQIWTQINTHLADFGKDRKYDIVLGANGSGSVMYSNIACDVTEEAVAYINLKYNGN